MIDYHEFIVPVLKRNKTSYPGILRSGPGKQISLCLTIIFLLTEGNVGSGDVGKWVKL